MIICCHQLPTFSLVSERGDRKVGRDGYTYLQCIYFMTLFLCIGCYTYTHTERAKINGENVERLKQLSSREYKVYTSCIVNIHGCVVCLCEDLVQTERSWSPCYSQDSKVFPVQRPLLPIRHLQETLEQKVRTSPTS